MKDYLTPAVSRGGDGRGRLDYAPRIAPLPGEINAILDLGGYWNPDTKTATFPPYVSTEKLTELVHDWWRVNRHNLIAELGRLPNAEALEDGTVSTAIGIIEPVSDTTELTQFDVYKHASDRRPSAVYRAENAAQLYRDAKQA